MVHPLNQNALAHLTSLAFAAVQKGTDESDCYGVLTEMLIEHRVLLGRSFIVFPQLHLLWKPRRAKDRRYNIPDVGLGRLLPDGRKHLQGGAEQKAAIRPIMRDFPSAADIIDHPDLRRSIHEAKIQASDQVKAAIKNGALPHNVPVKWILAAGPYFCIQHFGPFSEADLDTRGHRPNDSGEAEIADFIQGLMDTTHSRPLTTPLYRIGTPDAASVMHRYLSSPEVTTLYSSTNRFVPVLSDTD